MKMSLYNTPVDVDSSIVKELKYKDKKEVFASGHFIA